MKLFVGFKFIAMFLIFSLILSGCQSNQMQSFKTKEEAIEFGIEHEQIDEILAIEEVQTKTYVIFDKNAAIGVASIDESNAGFSWNRTSPYLDLIPAKGAHSIIIQTIDLDNENDLPFTNIIGKVYDSSVKNIIVHSDGNDQIINVNSNRLFYYKSNVPLRFLSFTTN